jgi:uncharacterized protein YodC (DUF2158 family)
MEKFKCGDIVALKSGGPPMTVMEDAILPDHWSCVWFEDKILRHYTFPAVALEYTRIEMPRPDSGQEAYLKDPLVMGRNGDLRR